MMKTTVYLPRELKAALGRVAREENRSEAELIREAIRARVERSSRLRPRVPLVERPLGDATASERVDELLAAFGES